MRLPSRRLHNLGERGALRPSEDGEVPARSMADGIAVPPAAPTRSRPSPKSAVSGSGWNNVRKTAGVTVRWHDNRHTLITELAEKRSRGDDYGNCGPCVAGDALALRAYSHRGQAEGARRGGAEKVRSPRRSAPSAIAVAPHLAAALTRRFLGVRLVATTLVGALVTERSGSPAG